MIYPVICGENRITGYNMA